MIYNPDMEILGRFDHVISAAAWSASPREPWERMASLAPTFERFNPNRPMTFFLLKLNAILDGAEIPPVLAAPTWRHVCAK